MAPNGLFRPPFQRWCSTHSGAVQGRVALGSALSFVSFSLGLFLQRKAAKKSLYLKIAPQTLTTAYLLSTFSLKPGAPLSCLTYVSHLLRKIESEKVPKKKCRIACATGVATRKAVAFEKATQNTRLVCANIVRNKSKIEIILLNGGKK